MERAEKRVLMNTRKFPRIIWSYYRAHGRDFPWRNTHNPYHILVSEIMLQQTQVSRVVLFYEKFLKAFPNFLVLSHAPLARILRMWQGLGYNRRALYLQKLAAIVAKQYEGKLPKDRELLMKLPGIGRATAGAIASFAFNAPIPFVETNIRRVFIHFFFPRAKKVSDVEVLPLVEKTLDRKNPREWYYALMDYGAMLGREGENPNRRSKAYRRQPPFRGSRRELRGKVIALLAQNGPLEKSAMEQRFSAHTPQMREALAQLQRDGFINIEQDVIFLK